VSRISRTELPTELSPFAASMPRIRPELARSYEALAAPLAGADRVADERARAVRLSQQFAIDSKVDGTRCLLSRRTASAISRRRHPARAIAPSSSS